MIDELICGDSLVALKDMPDSSFDACVSDPPFGIGFKYGDKREITDNPEDYWSFLKPIYEEILRVLKPGGFFAFWQANKYFKYFWTWFGEDIRIYCAAKNFVQLRKTPINYGYDPIVIKYKEGAEPLRPTKPKRNLDFFVANTAKWVAQTGALARKHPAPRPIDQVETLVDNFTKEGALILDPFIGSGTLAVAAKRLGRFYTGIEISQEYIDLARQRIEANE